MDRDFKYHLQHYQGMATRHECPGCGDRHSFTFYVDDAGCILDESVGRCDHESGCGYHYTPAQFFEAHPERRPGNNWREGKHLERRPYSAPSPRMQSSPVKAAASSIDTIPYDYVQRSSSLKSTFIQFLCGLFDADAIKRVAEQYAIGATKAGDVIFWQMDCQGLVRGGKIIKYNPQTGHRIKDGAGHVDWVHSRMKKMGILPDTWVLSQCLFGEHLLRRPGADGKSIALVESEKSAIIGAAAYPKYIWMATGGIGNLKPEWMEALKGHTIIIFPDIDGTAKWREKAAAIRGCKVIISDILERHATPEEREAKIDLADWIIKSRKEARKEPIEAINPPQSPIHHAAAPEPSNPPIWSEIGIPHLEHQSTKEEELAISQMIEENPAMEYLMDSLGLVVTGFKQFETDEDFRAAILEEPKGDSFLKMIDKAAANRSASGEATAIVKNNK